MITGITPVEAAYGYAGYVVSGQIMSFMKYLFPAVFLFGMTWMIYQSIVQYKNLKPLFTYFILVTLLWVVFGRTSKSISNPESRAAKEGSGDTISPSSILAVSSSGKISPGFLFVSQGMDAIVNGAIKTLDSITVGKGKGYYTLPFAGLQMQSTLSNMLIDDPELKKQFSDWCNNCYAPARIKYGSDVEQGKTKAVDDSWPENISSYLANTRDSSGKRGDTVWLALKDDIYKYAVARYKGLSRWKRYGAWVGESTYNRDNLIRYMYKRQLRKEQTKMTGLAGAGGGGVNKLYNFTGKILTFFSPLVLAPIAHAVINSLPFIQGFVIFITIAIFPIILLISFFPNNQSILGVYFLSLFAIKFWNFLWALLSNFSNTFIAKAITSSTSGFSSAFVVPIVILIMIPLAPAASFMLIKGSVQGFAGAGSAVGGGAEKAAGTGTAVTTKKM